MMTGRRLAVAALSLTTAGIFAIGVASAQTRETAAVAPRADWAALPRILSQADAARYAEIFDLQRAGKWQAADRLIAELEDPVLMGHVLFQRYMHPTAYRSKFTELRDWMKAYADLPGADRIYRLALRRKPAGYRSPAPPRAVELPDMDAVDAPLDEVAEDGGEASRRFAGKTGRERGRIRAEQRRIRRWVGQGRVTRALERLSTPKLTRLFDPVSHAESLGVIAGGYYRYHYDAKAIAAAADAEALAGADAAQAHWWGGLASFRAGDWARAARHFEQLSRSVEADSWLRAAGGYWASRAFLRSGEPSRVDAMLIRAAAFPRTFYGLLANRALGVPAPLNFRPLALSSTDAELLTRILAARRAIALIEAGQTELADAELRRLVDELPPAFMATLLTLADRAGLADVVLRIGRDMERRQGVLLDGALYPLPGWTPFDGYRIDQALIFAVMRQESGFRTRATNPSGARGLMQLMPATAGFLAGESFRGAARAKLYEPALNLSLGQKYIRYLFDQKEVDGNLFYALAAYDAGPGTLQRWRAKVDYADDPLLFIESLPFRETRNYIESVLSNYWIYRMRLGQDPVSMDRILGGRWPHYVAQDGVGPGAGPVLIVED